MTIAEILAPFINPANAALYAAQTDQYLWVAQNIVTAADLPESAALIEWVEDRLIDLIA